MKKNLIWKLLALVAGFFSALLAANIIVPLITGGKTFMGRSLIVQVLLLVGISCAFYFFYLLLIKIMCFVFLKIWDGISKNKKMINTFSIISKMLQRIDKSPLFGRVIFIAVLLIGSVFLFVHVKIITFPYPMELREGAEQLTTYALLEGINPYALENNPTYINVYGMFYNLIVLPFALIFGNTLSLHRFINGMYILGQLILLAWVLRSHKCNHLEIIIALLFMWLGQIFYVTPLARPDTLGELLFLLTLFIPFMCNFNNQSLFLSMIFGVLSFYTKVYFFLGVIIVLSYLFIFISKRKAIFFSVFLITLMLITVFITNQSLPMYFVNTVYPLFTSRIKNDYERLFSQGVRFIQDYWGLFLLGLILLFNKLKNNKEFMKIKIMIKTNSPLIRPKMDFILFCLIMCSLPVLLLLGKHSGTRMTYFYQLITPFFVLIILSWIRENRTSKNFMYLLLILSLLPQSYRNLKPDFVTFHNDDWEILDQRVAHASQILNSPLSVSLLLDHEKPVTISGLTEYYYFSDPTQQFILFADTEKIFLQGRLFVDGIVEKIKSKEYDFLETFQVQGTSLFTIGSRLDENLSDEEFISQYYHLTEILTFNMPHARQQWKIGIWEAR
jgi:hypothetical protein